MTDRSTSTPVVLVFGAYGGIGSSLVRRLADRATLAVSGRDEEKLSALADEVGASPFPADAADFGAVEKVLEQVVEAHGRVDAVVNAVGSVMLRPAHLTREPDWEEVLRTNLTSAFAVTRAAARTMSRAEGGSIVLFSTAAARHGIPNHEAIAAAKAGVDGLVRSAAATYGPSGVRVNSIAPGLVDTPMTSRITGNERALESSRAMHPLGRIGEPGEIAAAVSWLISDEASWVTGQTIGVDGGLGSARGS